ncbi:hypothetical protein EJ02DRAFT_206463 [Clathrospora elynae]|uniref:Uncharacterized protein n=1 Tax=Clathrospora elynae TaxID=706981 RepID=A0A6A5SNV6_9PLEO|nr:hypothetical protein EJ02DRAFT_206463 [Clathrospora elynae]
MHRHTMSETAGMVSARSSRTHSFSSDHSMSRGVTFQMPSTVRPAPAYIAASVASQTVTDHHNAHDVDCEELQNAVFSEQALALLNAFLDQLLFAFLAAARSPSLTAIRPAILEVLKPRLAREAMEAADEELQGLLAGEDDEELSPPNSATGDNWDVEKVWKRTRLRVMVYTRLGELEDEDEDKYVQQERGLSMDRDDDGEAGLVSWASAIFLTSVVEYVAEQTLLVAGSAAFARMAAKMKKLAQQLDDAEEQSIERLIIEEPDVEKIALNAALGRLWRTWRKRVRSPLSPGRGVHPVASYSSLQRRRGSRDMLATMLDDQQYLPEYPPTETDIAANIPLPLGDNDVNEIEVPGLAQTYEGTAESASGLTLIPSSLRRSSVGMLTGADTFQRSTKERPRSMPIGPVPFFVLPVQSPTDELELPFQTPMEHMPDGGYMGDDDEDDVSEQHDVAKPDQPEGLVIPRGRGYDSEPKLMRGKRMSIERTGAPSLIRTFSTRSSSLKSPLPTPLATPRITQPERGRSYLDDDLSDEEPGQHNAIGIAKTSNVPIRSTSSTPVGSLHEGRGPAHGGYIEVHPRGSAPMSAPYRSSPTPDAKPIIPERSVARNEVANRSLSGSDFSASSTQYEGPTSAPRRDVPLSASRGASLPSLKEAVMSPAQFKKRSPSEHNRGSSSHSSKHSLTSANRDGPVYVPEARLQRISTNGSMRSQQVPSDRSPSDKTSLKRGASSASSVKKPGSYAPASSGRDSAASHRSRNISGRMSEEDRAREFDSLVKGKETVKFTLTPQSVRDLGSPVLKTVEPRRPSTSSIKIYPRVNAEDPSFGTANLPNTTASRAKDPTTAQHKPSPSRKVVSRSLARDPKIEGESMRDFADFIRSTGPSAGQEKPVQPFVNSKGSAHKSANTSTSSLGRKLSTRQSPLTTSVMSPKPRANMEPRSPAGLSTGNDDLIDFIRQGPPNANNGQPRIPRSVAPFRTTVDSDQFDSMLGGHNVESAYGSTSSTLESKNSTQTLNSRTGLIPAPSVVQPAYSNTPQQLSGSMASNAPEHPHLTRTRHRVKDPYAIDFSDEDDDDDNEDEDQLTALPHSIQPSQPQSQPRQESIMDFLNGMDPPSTGKPQPFLLSEATIAAAKARASASNPSLTSSNSTSRNGYGNAPAYGTMSSNYVSSGAPHPYKPRLQARAPAVGDARGGATARTVTSDLADFLMNSGPPEPPVQNVRAVRKEEEKKSRKFWRRGKTYGDLP